VDERCIVNAMVALLATGGSTNHLIHWVAVARRRHPDRLDDFSELSARCRCWRASTPTAAPT
jgi:phosphogluconate dehydratase